MCPKTVAPIRPPLAGRPVRVSVTPATQSPAFLWVRMLETVVEGVHPLYKGALERVPHKRAEDYIARGLAELGNHPEYLQVRMLKTVGTAWQSCFAGELELLKYEQARDWIANGWAVEEP